MLKGWVRNCWVVSLIITGLAFPEAVTFAEEEQVSFELRTVVEKGAGGSEVLPVFGMLAGAKELSVLKEVLLDRSHLEECEVVYDPVSKTPMIEVTLTRAGADRFSIATASHVGRMIAVVIDGKIVSAPKVNEPISGGKFHITGNFTTEAVEELAGKLVRSTKEEE